MNLKNIVKIFSILFLIFIIYLFLYIKKEPINQDDLLPIGKIFILFTISLYLKISLKKERFEIDSSKYTFWAGLLYNLSLFLCGFIFLKHSIFLYHKYLIWKFLIFFTLSILFLLSFFYNFINNNEEKSLIPPIYKQESVIFNILKVLIATGFAFLGVFFIKANKVMLATVAYLFLIIQLDLIFKLKSESIVQIDKNNNNYGINIYIKIFILIAFFISIFLYYFSFISLSKYNIYYTIIYFILGCLFFKFSSLFQCHEIQKLNAKNNIIFDYFYSVFIFIFCLLIFSYKLFDILPSINGDEVLSINMAKKLSKGEIFPVILEQDLYNGMALLYYMFIAWAGKIFGLNLITGRWLSIIVGSLEVLFVYLLIKDIFNRRVAVISTLFLSTFFMQIFYSRIVLQWIWVPAFATFAYYFFFNGLKTGYPLFFILSGLFLSINLGFYSAAKISPFVPIFFIIILLFMKNERNLIISNWRGILLMFLTLLLTFLPIIDYMINFPDKYFKRMGHVSLLHHFPYNFTEWQIFFNNILKNVQMFFTESSNGFFHNIPSKPFLDEYTSILFLIGFAFLLITWKRINYLFVLIWLIFGLIPGFLSKLGLQDPYPARTVLAIPALIITISIGLERILSILENLFPKIFKYFSPIIILYFLLIFAFYNLRNYFIIYPKDPHILTYSRYTERLVYDYLTQNSYRKILISYNLSDNALIDMMENFTSDKLQKYVKTTDVSLFQLYDVYDNKKDVSIIGDGINYKMLQIYKEYFPSTKINIVWDYNFWIFDKNSDIKYCYEWKYPDKTIDINNAFEVFYLYDPYVKFVRMAVAEIPLDDILATYTFNAKFYKNNKIINEKKIVLPFTLHNEEDYDTVILSGLIDIPKYSIYDIKLNYENSQLFIDDKLIKNKIELYKGLHKIRLVIKNKERQQIMLQWKDNNNENMSLQNVENRYIINSDKIYGLLASYKFNDTIFYKQLEPVIDYRYYFFHLRPAFEYAKTHNYCSVNSCEIEWNGYLNIEDSNVYSFKFDTLNDSKIIINNNVIYKKEDGIEKIIPIHLKRGKNLIKVIRHAKYHQYEWFAAHKLRLLYKKHDRREFSPVTYNMLSPE